MKHKIGYQVLRLYDSILKHNYKIELYKKHELVIFKSQYYEIVATSRYGYKRYIQLNENDFYNGPV